MGIKFWCVVCKVSTLPMCCLSSPYTGTFYFIGDDPNTIFRNKTKPIYLQFFIIPWEELDFTLWMNFKGLPPLYFWSLLVILRAYSYLCSGRKAFLFCKEPGWYQHITKALLEQWYLQIRYKEYEWKLPLADSVSVLISFLFW